MSRCFSFPPPGYEKKARPDDAELLKKEQHSEKKHKREKRDKEKKEGKEKREKDGTDRKNREKKERKEKHRDKKKNKEKDRDKEKEKSSSSEEKRVAGQFDCYNGEKLHQKEERGKDKSSRSDEKKPTVQFQGHNGDKPSQNSLLAKDTEDSKFVLELARRIRDEEKGTGSQLVEGFNGTDRKKDEGFENFAVRDIGILAEGKEKNNNGRVDDRKMDGQRMADETRFSANAMAQNLAGVVQNKVEGMPIPVEKKMEREMEGKEKPKEREGDDKRGSKRKSKDREKQSQGKDKDREKEKKKEEKAKEKSGHKKTEKDNIKHINKNDLIGALNNKASHLSKDRDKNASTEGNLKKRKDIETNGFLHDNELRPNKMPRPTSHLLTENGRILEPCQNPSLFSSDKQGTENNLKVDNKERKVNGIIAVQPLSLSTTKPSSAITDQSAEAASMKPPHPDTKYLSQVLSVPKMEECSEFDDQEWLFSCKDPPLKKPEVGSVGVNDELQIWAEALQIESAEVYALPYVIPY